jgi:hypothetical protein
LSTKTGTLTEGKPRLVGVTAIGDVTEDELLQRAASLELGSEHPLAAAIVAGAEARGLKISPAGDFDTVPGKGVTGLVDGRRVAVGNAALLASLGIEPPGIFEPAREISPRAGADHLPSLSSFASRAANTASVERGERRVATAPPEWRSSGSSGVQELLKTAPRRAM